MQPDKTPNELISILKGFFSSDKSDTTPEKYRYVIYARKSTESEERQVRSLGDQVIECAELAEKNDLNIVKQIKESESAKEPDIRPKFREMIEEVKKGKFDGILAWHPDRLARNMKDAGELIDLLDKQIIKDLKFVSFTFENNTMGKMLLGIAFVLSKQYSDQLSDNVKRGIRRSIEEGKWLNLPKHGYYKDRNQLLRPDKENYNLIKNGFKMRLENKTIEEIAEYLNKNSYQRKDNLGNYRISKMDKKRVSLILKDPFYTGVLIYGETIVNLFDLYDFVPMITVEEFLKINKVKNFNRALKLAGVGSKENIKADLMRGMIICGECGEKMTAGITTKQSKTGKINYFYYRCDNQDCKNRGKSIRARVIVNSIVSFLNDHKFTTPKIYQHYKAEMKRIIEQRQEEIELQLKSLKKREKALENKFEKTKLLLLNEESEETKGYFKNDLKKYEDDISAIESRIKELKSNRDKNNNVILTYEKFVELFDKLAEITQKIAKMEDLDYIIRKLFLNFTIKDKKVANFSLNSPFKEFTEKGFVSTSRAGGT